ncbi:MAG: general secretion pathway protein GspE [Archangiaceae bacterium]|nr:general secretion pathway protein GspE [Archangiaceae bacterium]
MLVEEKLVSSAQVEEGLETQVVHGGRLGTNLVELGFLPEKELARMLGKQYGVAYASGEMQPDPAAMGIGDASFFDDHDILPMRVEPTRLTVAVMDPRRIEPLDQLSFKAGKRVVPVVIPEFRMNQLLRKHCKAYRTLRPLDMNTLRPPKAVAEQQGPSPAAVSDLINEDDFANLYAQAAAGRDEPEEDVPIEGEIVEPSSPALTIPRPSLTGVPPPAPLEPLSFAEAQAAVARSVDREDVARNVLRFAVSKFARALILSVQGELLTGWRGAGKGVMDKAVRRIGVSLRENSSFRLVLQTKSHYVGPMKGGKGTAMFYKLLKGGVPKSVVMMPLLVRGKLVHIVYVDQGSNQLTPPDIGELLILSQAVGRAYEAMIRQRQMKQS